VVHGAPTATRHVCKSADRFATKLNHNRRLTPLSFGRFETNTPISQIALHASVINISACVRAINEKTETRNARRAPLSTQGIGVLCEMLFGESERRPMNSQEKICGRVLDSPTLLTNLSKYLKIVAFTTRLKHQ
jgi:hypothetical protein